jgi:hypothetical protein
MMQKIFCKIFYLSSAYVVDKVPDHNIVGAAA